MIESAIINALAADVDLTALLSTYKAEPAIFSEFAPEDAEQPYSVVSIRVSGVAGDPVHAFTVMIDTYDYNRSSVNIRKIAERIEYVLDQSKLSHDRYDSIRLYFFAGSQSPEDDPRQQHYNSQFMARAGRKKWMQQLT